MAEVAYLIFLLLTLFGKVTYSINHAVLFADIKPKIISEGKENTEIMINAGENHSFICQCLHHITWRHFNTTILNVEDDRQILDLKIFERTLRLTNVSARDTGYYYCMLTETRSGLNFDQDLEYAAKMGEASRIYVYVNDTASPLVPVNTTIVGKLYSKIIVPCKPSSKSTQVELKNRDKAMYKAKYNPTIGYTFIVNDTSMSRSSIVCQPKIAKNFNSRIEFNIIVEPYENFLNTPFFKLPKEAIGDGDNLTIQCNVLLKNSDDYEMIWIMPHEIGVERYNITNHTIPDKNIPEIKHGRSVLTINNATFEENKGLYTCIVKNKANNLSSNRSTFVNMWRKFKPVVKGQKDYYIKAGENITAKCICHAYPPSNITWHYTECTPEKAIICASRDWEERNLKAANVTQSDKLTFSSLESTITFQPSLPGVIRCKANNKLGLASERSQVWLNDLDSDFKIDSANLTETILIGDNVTLMCGATIYNHSDVNWYRKSRLLETNKDYEVIQVDTTYSKRKLLIIKNITQSEIYECTTTLTSTSESTLYSKYTGFTDRLFVLVNVEKPQLPNIKYPMKKVIQLKTGEQLLLKCNATGTPTPTIAWLKDEKPISFDDGRMKMDNVSLTVQSVNISDGGTYKCNVSNRLNSTAKYFEVQISPVKSSFGWIIGLSVILIFLIFCIIYISFRFTRERRLRKNMRDAGLENFEEGEVDRINPELPLEEQAELLPYNRIFDFPKEKLRLGRLLGAGAYGIVLEAVAEQICDDENETKVAVKMVKKMVQNDVMKALVSELKILANLGRHLNVVNLLGAVTENIVRRDLMIIVEYCKYGNLRHYLLKKREEFVNQIDPITGDLDANILTRNHSLSRPNMHGIQANENNYLTRPESQTQKLLNASPTIHESSTSFNFELDAMDLTSINTSDLILWSFQIARGMDYLASRNVVHGDLAARNILLCENKVVKICDFGLARSTYKTGNYFRKEPTYIPIKWLPPESLRDHIFSTSTDIWSFGIVMWELFSLGMTPYPNMEIDHVWFPIWFKSIVDGYRMSQPAYSTNHIYKVMLACWRLDGNCRPSFKDLEVVLARMMPVTTVDYYVGLNDINDKWNSAFQSQARNDCLKVMESLEEKSSGRYTKNRGNICENQLTHKVDIHSENNSAPIENNS